MRKFFKALIGKSNEIKTNNHMDGVPNELIFLFFDYLDIHSLSRASQVNKRFNSLANSFFANHLVLKNKDKAYLLKEKENLLGMIHNIYGESLALATSGQRFLTKSKKQLKENKKRYQYDFDDASPGSFEKQILNFQRREITEKSTYAKMVKLTDMLLKHHLVDSKFLTELENKIREYTDHDRCVNTRNSPYFEEMLEKIECYRKQQNTTLSLK